MSSLALRLPGFSLLELLVALVVASLLAQIAAPRLGGVLLRLEARGSLDRLAADLHFARMLAVHRGTPVEVRLVRDRRCLQQYRIRPLDRSAPALVRRLPAAVVRLCPRHTGSGVLVFGTNGVLRPTGLTITLRVADTPYQIVVSSVGRVLRRY